MLRSGACKWACAGLSALGLFWSFPPGGSGVLAFVALVPLLYGLERASGPGEAFRLGMVTGLLFYTANLYWLNYAMISFGGLPWLVGFSLLVLLSLYVSLYLGAFCFLWVRLSPQNLLGRILWAGVLWAALEFVRTYLLTGFPWTFLAYTQFDNLSFLQLASLGGLYGLSLIIVWVNAALASAIHLGPAQWRRGAVGLLSAVLALGVALLYGRIELGQPQAGTPLKVAALQGNIDQWVKWDPAYQQATMKTYRELTEAAASQKAHLIVWPETAVPFVLGADLQAQVMLGNLARSTGSYLLVGSPDVRSGSEPLFFNSAFLVTPRQGIVQKYDKVHLVPFGEYVPLRKILFFVDKMVRGAVGDFQAGTEYTLFRTSEGQFGVTISYEVYFPAQVRRYFQKGADFLVNITNDAWYGRSAAPYQHLAMAVFRAVENGAYVVRAANTGISAIIDPQGRVLEESEIFVPAVVTGEIRNRSRQTFYTQFGDLLAGLCLAGSAIYGGGKIGISLVRLLHSTSR